MLTKTITLTEATAITTHTVAMVGCLIVAEDEAGEVEIIITVVTTMLTVIGRLFNHLKRHEQ